MRGRCRDAEVGDVEVGTVVKFYVVLLNGFDQVQMQSRI